MTPSQISKLLERAESSDSMRPRATFIRKKIEELARAFDQETLIADAETRLREAQEALAAARAGIGVKVTPKYVRPLRSEEDKAYDKKVRDWAWAAGYHCGNRGRVPQDLKDMYEKSLKKDVTL